ncbi:F-box protein CPR30-like isoform X1 [Solanum tuberosum]|uniref:F-box domain-containing protein n=1 Tax=Solanum tuberosum TaxID=4113 RepID=M1B0Y1_SOLTU|nr:PREDICTED: F-box protein CPR30-like isoform X1 [Solanum tuberosum]XP_015166384.1 PREDICTED: F-box protein CPR30-like isoform X1 [Solanum tuberosum]
MTRKIKNERKLADSSYAPEIQKQKKKSIATPKLEVDLFNQILISNGIDAIQKFNQISKGKSVVEPSNDNTDQMDVDAMAVHFPEVILMDILSRLPVQSLLRFKCVSKFWETLISEPYFKMKHLSRAKNDQDSQKLLTSLRCRKNGICSMYCCPLSPVQLVEDVQKLDFPSNPTPLQCTIHCCYDGLAVMEVPDNLNEHSTFFLWNPSTRESIVLPSPEFPLDKSPCFGLGYDSTSGEYRIVQIYQGFDLPCEILALKGGSWRRSDKHPHGIYSLMFAVQFLTFVHAAFHWIGISRNYAVVVSFSISNEVYGEIPLQEEISVSRDVFGITVLDGMLCVHSNSLYDQSKHTIKLWVLKEYGIKESWIPLLSIEDPYIVIAIPKYRFADGEVLFRCGVGG